MLLKLWFLSFLLIFPELYSRSVWRLVIKFCASLCSIFRWLYFERTSKDKSWRRRGRSLHLKDLKETIWRFFHFVPLKNLTAKLAHSKAGLLSFIPYRCAIKCHFKLSNFAKLVKRSWIYLISTVLIMWLYVATQ